MDPLGLIDYRNCLSNLACSILEYFGIQPPNPTLAHVDALLQQRHPRHVLLILCDGLGMDSLEWALPADSFLRRHLAYPLRSVFPPTTAAATTSIQSGLYPNQHGWLGWNGFFPEIDQVVTLYWNVIKDTATPAAPYHLAHTLLGYDSLSARINRLPGCAAATVSPFDGERYEQLDDMVAMVRAYSHGAQRTFVYAYYPQPDALMHEFGTRSPQAREAIVLIDEKMSCLCRDLPDTLVLITADHGLVDTQYDTISDMPDLFDCLARDIAVDTRAAMFFVKEGRRQTFADAFRRRLGRDYLLLSREEFLRAQVFGTGQNHPHFAGSIGDYLAIATAWRSIRYSQAGMLLKGAHSGLTTAEMLVPLIVC